MDKNNTTAVTEKQRAIRDDIAKISKPGSFNRVGMPVLSSTPPGTVADAANATVAMRAATTEQDSDVFVSHSPPLLTRSLWVLEKMSSAVSPKIL